MNNCLTCKYEPEWIECISTSGKRGICKIPLPPISSMPRIWIFKEDRINNDGLTIDGSEMPPCPAYVESYVKMEEALARSEVAQRIDEKVPVNIYYNNEAGEWLWTVQDANDLDFWLASFETEKEAIAFCENNNLSIVEVIK